MIEIIGAPFDLCGMRLGSRLGPAALRLAGLIETLRDLGLDVVDGGDVVANEPWSATGGMRNFPPLLECIVDLRKRCAEALGKDRLPVVLGGEHTLVVGGIAAALDCFAGDLAVVWIDAHADVNTPGTSSSGNIHGMPLAALRGMPSGTDGVPDLEWNSLLSALGPCRLGDDRTAWFGLRDVDTHERSRLQGLPITMHDIDRFGVEATVRQIDAFVRATGAKHLWISFDVDALDPILAPGTGTAVRGGLSYREAHLTAELLREALDAPDCPYALRGIDLVETNPLYDSMNSTAILAVEWIASLLGKTILGSR